MSSRCLIGTQLAAVAWPIMALLNPAVAAPHHLEARLAPSSFAPQGTALAVRYDHGPDTKLHHDWQPIAVLNTLNNHLDHNLLNYRLIVEQVDQVHASVLTVTVQYRLVAQE